jgi:hypothetical protein
LDSGCDSRGRSATTTTQVIAQRLHPEAGVLPGGVNLLLLEGLLVDALQLVLLIEFRHAGLAVELVLPLLAKHLHAERRVGAHDRRHLRVGRLDLVGRPIDHALGLALLSARRGALIGGSRRLGEASPAAP